jgi:hypothetical protein
VASIATKRTKSSTSLGTKRAGSSTGRSARCTGSTRRGMRLAHMHANGMPWCRGDPEEAAVEALFEHALAAAPEHAEHECVDAVGHRRLESRAEGRRVAVVVLAEQRHLRLLWPGKRGRQPRTSSHSVKPGWKAASRSAIGCQPV